MAAEHAYRRCGRDLHARLVAAVLAALGLGALGGCSPLTGDTLDPVYLKAGSGGDTAAASAPSEKAESSSRPAVAVPGAPTGAPDVPKTTTARAWVGRYRDSRGEGDLTFSLVQGESTLSGTWKVRTGGGGAISGVLEAPGRRFRVHMENAAPQCPGIFDGWAEIGRSTLVGAYHGTDCEGAVSDGWLELRPK